MLCIYDNYVLINETSTRSISYIFHNKNEIDICFKGTSNIKDNYFNLNIYPKSYISPEIKVHHGFLSKYLSIKDIIIKTVNDIIDKNDIHKITCNGHSSGGAMASIAIFDIYEIIRIKDKRDIIMECFTFGSPRVGNREFINRYKEIVNKSVRIVNWNDIIQYVPPPIPYLYRHINKPLVLNECREIKDMNIYKYLKNSHGITRYIKNIVNCN
jgi:triacylglycerol lipase